MKQLEKDLFEQLKPVLGTYDFQFKASKQTFLRHLNGIAHMYQLVTLDAIDGFRVQPNVAVRIERVEEIFHRTSGFEPKYQKDTPTIGAAVGAIISDNNSACEFALRSDKDIMPVAEDIIRMFKEFALIYFEKYSSLLAIDTTLNESPRQRTPHRAMPWLRCSTGAIVAKLVDRPNYLQTIEIYKDMMSKIDKGFYLKRFEALVASLEQPDCVT